MKQFRGLCPRCGDVKEDDSFILCEKCRLFFPSAKAAPSRGKQRQHVCWACGKRLERDNKNHYCYRCLKKSRGERIMQRKGYDNDMAAAAQTKYCDENHLPIFAPRDGICPACGRDIYALYIYTGRENRMYGISVETAGKTLITNCPHCKEAFRE